VEWGSIDKTEKLIREKVLRVATFGLNVEIGAEEYFATFLPEVVSSLAADGGGIWMRSKTTLQLVYHFNKQIFAICESRFRVRHELLLHNAFRHSEPMSVQPGEDFGDEEGGNPTESLLLLSPIKVEGEIIGVVEIFQRAVANLSTQRGYQRFLSQMCELAGNSYALRRIKNEPLVQKPTKTPWWKFWK
jgi:hypothetical protein